VLWIGCLNRNETWKVCVGWWQGVIDVVLFPVFFITEMGIEDPFMPLCCSSGVRRLGHWREQISMYLSS